jgi:hypothetical protein
MARFVFVIFATMKSIRTRYTTLGVALLSTLLGLTTAPAFAVWPPPKAEGEELAVWQAMAGTIAREHESKPYRLWYSQSDFSAASFIASALADPDKEQFCGLSAAEVKTVVLQLKSASLEPVQLESDVAEAAGFKIAHKKNPRFRYFAMSRVVFDSARQKAWLSVELNGERGSIVRLDKVGGHWNRTSRCGGWYMPQD